MTSRQWRLSRVVAAPVVSLYTASPVLLRISVYMFNAYGRVIPTITRTVAYYVGIKRNAKSYTV